MLNLIYSLVLRHGLSELPVFVGMETTEDIIEKISQLNEQVNTLHQNLDKKREDINKKNEILHDQYNRSDKLQLENQALRRTLETLTQKHLEEIKETSSASDNRIRKLQESLEFSTSQCTQLYKDVNSSEEKISHLNDEVAGLKMKNVDHRETMHINVSC